MNSLNKIILSFLIVCILLITNANAEIEFSRTDYFSGRGPIDVVSADFDGDGDIDLAVLNSVVSLNDKSVYILRNNGDGSYTTWDRYVLNCPQSICSGDFDYDGDTDLAISDDDRCWSSGSGRVIILENDGFGQFNFGEEIDIEGGAAGLFFADIDGDGIDDITVTLRLYDKVKVYTNNGYGEFTPYVTLSVGDYPGHICVSDFDWNGYNDIAASNHFGGTTTILLNNGDGTFIQNSYYVGGKPGEIVANDFNSDGHMDLVLSNHTLSDIFVLVNSGGGSFILIPYTNMGYASSHICVGDFDKDGNYDIAASSGSDRVSILESDGIGGFGLPDFYLVGSSPWGLCPNDFDADGLIDLAVTNYHSQSESVLLNRTIVVQRVAFDIKPGSCPNPLNVKPYRDYYNESEVTDNTGFASVVPEISRKPNSKLPVAILGTMDFDVSQIDPTTITLMGVPALRWNIEDVSTPVGADAGECECTSLGPDGSPDLIMKFDKGAVIAALGNVYDGEVIPLTISGQLYDGTEFEGVDCVAIKGTIEEYEGDFATISDTQKPGLIGNHPNPFNPETEISYALAQGCNVRLDIFNIKGQKVVTLVDGYQDVGVHSVTWDSRGADGKAVASGIYLYRLTAGDYTETRKMILIK